MSDFFCPLPFIHQFISADGISYCCRPDHRHMVSIEEFENSKYLADARSKLLQGQIPQDCQLCKNDEDAGIHTMRLQALADFGNVTGPNLSYIDLRYDNLCNLACRMCNPGYSTTWVNEVEKYPELREYHGQFYRNNTAFKILDNFDNVTKNLKKLSLTGGEPLLIKEHLEILSRLIQQGRTNIELTITSNITALNPNWFNVIKKFNTVHWTVSLDGVEKVGEYIRWPYDWSTVDSNLSQLLTLKNSVAINCTLTIYSLLDLSNLVKYFVNKKQQAQGPFEIWFAVAEHPTQLSISAIPDELKDQIITEIETSINLLKNIPEHDISINTLAGILTLVKQNKPNTLLINKFWHYTKLLDQQRNQDFDQTYEKRI